MSKTDEPDEQDERSTRRDHSSDGDLVRETDVLSAPPDGDPVLELDDVSKAFGPEPVIRSLSLAVHEGEILTLLGPSGCGKTTTLRLIAGLDRPDAGKVRLNGQTVSGPSTFREPETRGVGVVFQDFALFPHLTARENVAFGLDEWAAEERSRRVDQLLDLVGLEAQADSYPDELSGGQQQRVALARSLAPEPSILLLDEPFSNLDVDLRVRMREEVRRILKEAGVTAVSVTHDQEEALSISDRVAVMHDGRVEQVGDPEEVFQHPGSRFVAGFLGHASFLPGEVRSGGVETSIGTVPRDQIHGLAPEYEGTRIDILVRPDDLDAASVQTGSASDAGRDATANLQADRENPDSGNGIIRRRRYLGPTILYEVELADGSTVECMHNHDERLPLEAPVQVSLKADHELSWFPPGQRGRREAVSEFSRSGTE